ncbi:MAG: carboxylesterase family protein [Butyrivibrio sp.]|nr:carboxylesterase family protein [Butyrivibrio sp.]
MKKLFTVDDFIVAFISALGYGFGEAISKLLGWPEILCGVASMVLGIVLQGIITRIAFSKAVQESLAKRIITYASVLLIFLVAQYIAVWWMGVDLLDYLSDEFVFVILFPVLGFVLNMLIRGYKAYRIRKRYGDGSNGYVFDLKKEDIDATNQENNLILGEYDKDCAVKTRIGIFVGEKTKKTISFLGIPYAKPPVGELRWKAPEPLESSDAVFEAKNLGASAIQVEHVGSILKNYRQSEDCLTLNICTGIKESETAKPVVVLFHNGDFSYGGTADPLLYGENFITEHPDIVFVSFNFRLGIFGFIDFSEVPGGDAYPDTLNLGLLDQIAALEWIKENIAAFGGDPERISVMGFGAGATSIILLAASRRAKGLFKKAFAFNGSPELAYATPDASRKLAKELLRETGASSMEELVQTQTDTLKEAAQRLWQNMCAPTCGGALLPADVYSACEEGAASGIDFIIGIPKNEAQNVRSIVGDQNFEEALSVVVSDIKNSTDSIISSEIDEYIRAQAELSNETAAKSKVLEQWNALYIYRIANSLSKGGNSVHLLYWNEKPLIENLGSGTIDVLATMLGNSEAAQMYGSVVNADLSEVLQSLLIKLINGADLQLYPNEIKGVGGIDWEVFPKALIVEDEKLICDTLEDRLTQIKGVFDYMTS